MTLSTSKIEDERGWWLGRLGLPGVGGPSSGAPAGGFAVAVGDGVLAFEPAPSDAPAPSHHVALEVAEDRLIEASRWFERAAPLIPLSDGETVVDFPNWVAHSVYARTPSGHIVELIARHRRPWTPSVAGADGPELVRGISEVGVCTPDVGALVDRLAALGAPLWFGDPTSGFAAAGDEAGLLICVREWRPWFPTDQPAVPGPLSIELTGVPGLVPGEPVPVGSATELWALEDR